MPECEVGADSQQADLDSNAKGMRRAHAKQHKATLTQSKAHLSRMCEVVGHMYGHKVRGVHASAARYSEVGISVDTCAVATSPYEDKSFEPSLLLGRADHSYRSGGHGGSVPFDVR